MISVALLQMKSGHSVILACLTVWESAISPKEKSVNLWLNTIKYSHFIGNIFSEVMNN